MKIFACRFLAVVVIILSSNARADLSPESVAVVVNGDSWASLTIANEYVRLRGIPDCNIIILNHISSFERMTVDTFRAEILKPVFATIEARGLKEQIDCITYSVDLPTSVNIGSDAKGRKLPQVITPVASTNGLTYLHEWVMDKDIDYLQLDINRYSRRVLPLPTGTPLTQEEAAEYQRGMAFYSDKKFEEAVRVLRVLTAVQHNDPSVYYNLACCEALVGNNDEAMQALFHAVLLGWRDYQHTSTDSDLTGLHGRDDYKKLILDMQSATIEVQPTTGFRSTTGWDANGEPSDTGSHYMLSTMLGVTSGRGNSIAEVIACLRRAKSADFTSPRGTVYFLKNGDVRSTTREWAFADAGKQLNALGVRALTENGVLPQGKDDVAGASIGTATFDWKTSKSRILPGAIVEHLTSCGGMMRERDTQTPCTDFIRAGAAGSSGAVTEPYALQAKFPNAFMYTHYVHGSTLAEAFYQSVEGPYQLLILGDPLCKPWGKVHRVSISGIARNTARRGVVSIQPQVVGRDVKISSYLLFVDGRLVQTTKPGELIKLDTTAFSDGEHTIAVIGQHDNALATRDRMVIPVRFRNTKREVRISSSKTMEAAFGTKIGIHASAAGATRMEVTHLGRVVGGVDGDSGVIEVDTSRLGLGSALLQVRARYQDGVSSGFVRGSVVTVDVTSPVIQAGTYRHSEPAPAGLLISIDQGGAMPLLDTYKPTWLTEAGVGDGKNFEVSGLFEGDENGVWQLQMKTNTSAKVEIDGMTVAQVRDGSWLYRPIQLSSGTHLLRVTGRAPAGKNAARLDLRLGGTGTRSPSDRWMRQWVARR